MTSLTDISNRALFKIGAQDIMSNEEPRASSIRRALYDIIDMELRKNKWSFAMTRAQLPSLSDPPSYGFAYQYPLPNDYIVIDTVGEEFQAVDLSIYPSRSSVDYVIEDDKILTNEPAPLKIRYIRTIVDPNLWDSLFREVVICKLAIELLEPYTQSSSKKEHLYREYQDAVKFAKRSNSIERAQQIPAATSWSVSRL